MAALLSLDGSGDSVLAGYRHAPALYSHAIAGASPLPPFGQAGTGGCERDFERVGFGYRIVVVLPQAKSSTAPFADLMQEVKGGFGRTMSRLPEVFGVSRQTLYNWLDGETPTQVHQAKLRELAAAARVFTDLGFKPTSLSLDRSLAQGKSILQLVKAGADGAETARKLVRVVERGAAPRSKLDELLGGRSATVDASDLGTRSFDEAL